MSAKLPALCEAMANNAPVGRFNQNPSSS